MFAGDLPQNTLSQHLSMYVLCSKRNLIYVPILAGEDFDLLEAYDRIVNISKPTRLIIFRMYVQGSSFAMTSAIIFFQICASIST